MIGVFIVNELYWLTLGAAAVLLTEVVGWLYWRYLGEGSLKGYINENQKPEGHFKVIRKSRTATQNIALVDVEGEMWIYSNGEIMFSTTKEEDEYAEVIVHVPMAAARSVKNILIIGGGGGITTREALRYEEVETITSVDVDDIMFHFGKNLEQLVAFNNNSLHHPKVQTVIEDGRSFVENSSETWDVIIVDIPEPTSICPSLSRLFTLQFYNQLKDHLNPGGAISVACSTSGYMPEYMWSIETTLKEAGFFTLPFHHYSVKDGDWGYILATTLPVEKENIQLKVTSDFLTEDRLLDILNLPYHLSNREDKGKVQTDDNTVLLEIVKEAFGY
jgi:spermidine synthase